jgi:holin-like protein
MTGLTILLLCQLVGEILSKALQLPIPGPVIGMVLLFVGLVFLKKIPSSLTFSSDALLKNLALLFVPAGVGVMLHFQQLKEEWFIIFISIGVSTVITIAITGLVMQFLMLRVKNKDQ